MKTNAVSSPTKARPVRRHRTARVSRAHCHRGRVARKSGLPGPSAWPPPPTGPPGTILPAASRVLIRPPLIFLRNQRMAAADEGGVTCGVRGSVRSARHASRHRALISDRLLESHSTSTSTTTSESSCSVSCSRKFSPGYGACPDRSTSAPWSSSMRCTASCRRTPIRPPRSGPCSP